MVCLAFEPRATGWRALTNPATDQIFLSLFLNNEDVLSFEAFLPTYSWAALSELEITKETFNKKKDVHCRRRRHCSQVKYSTVSCG